MTVYATTADIETYGVGGSAFAGVAPEALSDALARASAIADEYLSQRFALPLTAWSAQLRGAVVSIAVHELFGVRGYNPEIGPDAVVRQRFDDAMRWLREVRDGSAAGVGLVDSSPSDAETRHIAVVSRQPRGW